jgi:hypothetical protein
VRLPAADFGSPAMNSPGRRTTARRTVTVAALRSRSARVSPASSPKRRPHQAASSTIGRSRSGIAVTMASSSGRVAMVTSRTALVLPAPRIRHGLVLIRSSAIASLQIVRSRL